MGLFGDILSTVVNVVNIPAEIADAAIGCEKDESFFSAPGKEVSKIVKKVDE